MMEKHKKLWMLSAATLLTLLFIGCGKEYDVAEAEAQEGRPYNIGNVSHQVTFNSWDYLFFETVDRRDRETGSANGSDYLLNDWRNSQLDMSRRYEWEGKGESLGSSILLWNHFTDSAWAKRKSALLLGRCKFTYDGSCYFNMDGVSALIYNVSYLFSIPRKALTSLRCMDGLAGYLAGLVGLVIGLVLSLIGIVLASLVGIVCHPLETLANLTAGLFYFGSGWWTYVTHTNFIASLWDLVWGGIIYPLWQALTFWL